MLLITYSEKSYKQVSNNFLHFVWFVLYFFRERSRKRREIRVDKLSGPVYRGKVHFPSWKHALAEYFTGVSHSSSVPDRGHLINPLQRHTLLIPPVSRCVFHGTHMVLPWLNRWDPGCTPRLENSQCWNTRIPYGGLRETKESDSRIPVNHRRDMHIFVAHWSENRPITK